MSELNVPKLMNAVLADLQSEAWTHGVKLVGDISTELVVDLRHELALQGCLMQVLGTVIRCVRSGSSISLVTALEVGDPEDEPRAEPALRIQIHAPSTVDARLDGDVTEMRRTLTPSGVGIDEAWTEQTWTLTLSVPCARLLTHGTQPRTAVVVDDDVDTQDFLRAVLESNGFRVISVSDGFDALLVIERYRPAVVLTDILMPNMNGIDLISRIKQAHLDMPVIVFSGYRDALAENIAGLPDRILPKPMTRDQLLAALDSVLAPS